jgi:hypothetical protein
MPADYEQFCEQSITFSLQSLSRGTAKKNRN